MALSSNWCQDKLRKLQIEEDTRLPILQEMKEYLTAIPLNEIAQTVHSLQLPILFDCLNNSDREQVDLTCDVLTLCMSNLNLGESTSRYADHLERALNHPFPSVKLMTLNEILRNVHNKGSLMEICKRDSLILNIIKCIGFQDISIGTAAAEILKAAGETKLGLEKITSPGALNDFRAMMDFSEIIRLRIYELFMQIVVQSEENFHTVKSTDVFLQIFNDVNSDDFLLRLNVLEILSQLGGLHYGYEFIESTGLLANLQNMLENDEDSLTLKFCQPGVLKFFGGITHWRPNEVIKKYPRFIDRIFNNLEGYDPTLLGVSIDVLGFIGTRNEGKLALYALGRPMEDAIKSVSSSIPSLPSELKVRAFTCLDNLLRVDVYNNQIVSITCKWYYLIDDNPMDYIMRYARSPFSEFRLGAFSILNSIAKQLWGQEVIRNAAGLIEFLLDRNVETVKECKEAKYEIIKVLSSSEIFDEVTIKRLQTFIQQGPFYVLVVPEVAIEGED